MRQLALVYADVRLTDEQLVEYTELAWQEIYELEYEQAFGGWRGAHLDEENDRICVTFDNNYGGPPLMVTVHRTSGERRIDYPPQEYVRKENENIVKLMKAMGLPDQECEKYRFMFLVPSES